jgi:Flp pilus assembly protein TadD
VTPAQADHPLADLRHVTDLRPGSQGFVAAATIDLRVRRLAAAERAASDAIRREPDNFSAWVLLAAARNAAGDSDGAREALVRARKLNPLYVVAG